MSQFAIPVAEDQQQNYIKSTKLTQIEGASSFNSETKVLTQIEGANPNTYPLAHCAQ